jgi:hypothetical protein
MRRELRPTGFGAPPSVIKYTVNLTWSDVFLRWESTICSLDSATRGLPAVSEDDGGFVVPAPVVLDEFLVEWAESGLFPA